MVQDLYYIAAFVGYLYIAGRWLLKRHDNSRKDKDFIEEIRTNHLPHIYGELTWQSRAIRAIAAHLGIILEEE